MTAKVAGPQSREGARPRPRGPGQTGVSARSLLLTVLGEFVFPRSGGAWTGTLVESLGSLGVEEKSARQAIARTSADGLLEPERHGRRVRWRLTASGSKLIEEGTQRIYGFMRDSRTWDGQWLIVTVGVPETQRNTRHRLRTRMNWLGLGSPSPGLWVIPDASTEDDVRTVLQELDLASRAFVWVGRRAADTDPAALISAAWDLEDVAERYREFIKTARTTEVGDDVAAFAAQVRLIQEWRQFPFLDPELPAELLSDDWPGPEAATTFHDLRDRWHRRAQRAWDRMETAAEQRS